MFIHRFQILKTKAVGKFAFTAPLDKKHAVIFDNGAVPHAGLGQCSGHRKSWESAYCAIEKGALEELAQAIKVYLETYQKQH